MYNNEDRIAFKKMHEFSPVDGFLEITEDMAGMAKFIANEPSVGLFYVQQHSRNAAPNLVNLKNKVSEKSHDTSLHTEDTEDSITTVRSMKECGFPIIEGMIGEIKKSLTVISTKQPKKGLIHNSTYWSPSNWGRTEKGGDDDESRGYLPSVFKSSKLRRGNNPKRAQVEGTQVKPSTSDSSVKEAEADNLQDEDESRIGKSLAHEKLGALYDSYEEFNAKRESELEEWLGWGDHKEIPGDLQEGLSLTGHNLGAP